MEKTKGIGTGTVEDLYFRKNWEYPFIACSFAIQGPYSAALLRPGKSALINK